MRLHVISLPHTEITRAYDWCAYTAKIRRLPRMLKSTGHECILYGSEGVDRDTWNACSEYVGIIGETQRNCWFDQPYWPQEQVFNRWEANDLCWIEWNELAITEISKRIEPGDGIGIIAGWCQEQIVKAFPNNPILEWGVGYPGILPNSFRAFESHAWRSFCTAQAENDDIRWFDTVIPNSYGLDEFIEPRSHGGYYLFVGRPTERKGLAVIRELAAKFPIKCAGQSDPNVPGAEYVGLVTGDEKAKLFSEAVAVLAPTIYFEPFGGVAVESQMAGVPVITTNHGAFTETVEHIVNGYRCSTLSEFIAACENASHRHLLSRQDIAERARAKWSLEAVAPLYDNWLRRIELLQGPGWYG